MEKFLSKIVTKIFWKNYCDLENREKTPSNRWFQNLTFHSILGWFELLNTAAGEEDFWHYYLNRSIMVNISLMGIHLLFHILFIACIMGFALNWIGLPTDTLFTHYNILVFNIFPWFLFSLVCLIFLLTVRYQPTILTYLNLDTLSIWMGIGNSIFFTRLLILVMRIHHYGVGNDCAAAAQYNNAVDDGFLFFALQMMIDMTAVAIFSVFPFPFRFNLYHCLVESISQLERIYSCGNRIAYRSEFETVPIIIGFIVLYSFLALAIYGLALEHSARKAFENTLREKMALDEKKQIVHFLCFDTNHLLAVFQSAVQSIITVVGESEEVMQLKVKIDEKVQVAAAAVNEMVLMVRVEEETVRKYPQYSQAKDYIRLEELLTKCKQDLTFGNSEEYGEAIELISTEAEDVQVCVDLGCLEILCRRFLNYGTLFLSASENRDQLRNDDMKFSMKLINLSEVKILTSNRWNMNMPQSLHFQYCALTWDRSLNSSWSPCSLFRENNIKSDKETCILIALRVVSTCQGYFWETPTGLHCIIPCKLIQRGIGLAVPPVSNIPNRLCVFMFDGYGDELRSVVERIASVFNCEICLFRGSTDIQAENLDDSDIVFIDTLPKSRELRELGFEGRIVLVSGLHSLVGAMREPFFDYSLPIPSLDEDISRFKIWLGDSRFLNRLSASETLLDENPCRTLQPWKRRLKEFGVSLIRLRLFGMKPLPEERRDIYLRWRMFSPVDLFSFHHTKCPDMLFFALFGMSAVFVSYGVQLSFNGYSDALEFIFFCSFVLRHWIYQYILKSTEVSLRVFLEIYAVYFIIVARLNTLMMYLISDASFISMITLQFSYKFLSSMSMDELLEQKFGILPFLPSVFGSIRALGLGEIILFPFSWPTIPTTSVLASLTLFLFVLALPRNIVSYQLVACILVFQFFSLLMELIITYNFEYVYRQEFSSLCDFILSNDLIQRSISLSQPIIRQALTDLKQSKLRLIELLGEKLQGELLQQLDDQAFLKALQSLQTGGLLVRELANELRMHQQSLEGISYVPTKGKYFLQNIMEDVIESFGGQQVIVRGRFDSRLSVVRFDKEQFITLLTCSLMVARKRIRRSSTSTNDSAPQMTHDIFIDIKALERENVTYRFADVRSLIVVVVDTSSVEEESTDSANTANSEKKDGKVGSVLDELELGDITASFSERVCESFVNGLQEHSLYETGVMEHEHYKHFTRFSFPYQLTMDSHTASEAIRDGNNTETYVQKTLFEALLSKLLVLELLGKALKIKRKRNKLKSLSVGKWREMKGSGLCCSILIVSSVRQGTYVELLVDALHRFGWTCLFAYPRDHLVITEEQQREVDCIMFDRCADYDCELNFSDMAIEVRAQGYRKLLVDLTPEIGGSTVGLLVEEVDLTVTAPLSVESGARLFIACEERIRSLLFINKD